MEHGDRVGDGRSDSEPKTVSGAPPGLEPVSQPDSTSAVPSAVGNPNPFWSERMQEEYRLNAARLGFLDDYSQLLNQPGERQLGVEAWQVPVRDDVSVDDEHSPYGQESQATPEEVHARFRECPWWKGCFQ